MTKAMSKRLLMVFSSAFVIAMFAPWDARAITVPDSGTCATGGGQPQSCLQLSTSGPAGFAIRGDSSDNQASPGNGVYGSATWGSGVFGSGQEGYGVSGQSFDGSGVFAQSINSYGIYATTSANTIGTSGVFGTSSIGGGTGVKGSVTGDGIGVWGAAHGVGSGVYGEGRGGNGYGVQGYNDSNGYGVYGQSSAGGTGVYGRSQTGAGVAGSSTSSNGIAGATASSHDSGVYGSNTSGAGFGVAGRASGTGIGVYGDNTNASGWAGYFNGKVFSSGGFTSSDARLKTEIKDLSNGLASLLRLRPVTYRWKAEGHGGGTEIGLIAQEVQKIVPEVVHADATTGMLALNYPALVPVTIKAIQEQQKVVDRQEAELASLRARLAALEQGRAPLAASIIPAGGVGAAFFLGLAAVGAMIARRNRKRR